MSKQDRYGIHTKLKLTQEGGRCVNVTVTVTVTVTATVTVTPLAGRNLQLCPEIRIRRPQSFETLDVPFSVDL